MLKYFENYATLSKTSKQKILESIKKKHFHRKTLLHEHHTVCNYFYYIKKGIVRIYYYKKDYEVTDGFIMENTPITAADSFFSRKPSFYNIELLEDSEIEYIHYFDMEKLFTTCPEMERIGRLITLEYLNFIMERVKSLQFETAQTRYDKLITEQPDVLLRAPLGMIASFLGITQETLSRIRSKK